MADAKVTIEEGLVEAIARRVVELLGSERSPRYVDAATVSRDLAVERDWVYSHADELGAIRLGGHMADSDSTWRSSGNA